MNVGESLRDPANFLPADLAFMRAVQPSCISTFFNASLSILGPFFSEDLDGGIDWNHFFSGCLCDGLS